MINIRAGESYEDYFVRLFENKDEYGLNCVAISKLLNAVNGNSYDESTYRKEYAAFKRGRDYERYKAKRDFTRILSISDAHVPFNLPVSVFSDYTGVDVLVINGDTLDCQQLSRFTKMYRSSPIEEMIAARQYFIDIINLIKPKDVYITYGNHEQRLGSYLAKNIDCDIQELLPETPLDLIIDDGFSHYNRETRAKTHYEPIKGTFIGTTVHYVGDWHVKLGKTIFAHPKAYSSGMLKTGEKAVNFFLRVDKDFDTICLAHTHKLGYYVQGGINIYEQGCTCRTESMTYTDGLLTLPPQKGFALICQDKDGNILPNESKTILIQ